MQPAANQRADRYGVVRPAATRCRLQDPGLRVVEVLADVELRLVAALQDLACGERDRARLRGLGHDPVRDHRERAVDVGLVADEKPVDDRDRRADAASSGPASAPAR